MWKAGVNLTPHSIIEHTHMGYFGKILTQIRLGLSPLRGQLFKYNISDNPYCPSCWVCIETPKHFFLDCPLYTVERVSMLSSITLMQTLEPTVNQQFLNFVLFGSCADQMPTRYLRNKKIYRLVTIYMYRTKRFIQHNFSTVTK